MKTSLLIATLVPLAAIATEAPLAIAFWDASGQRFTTDTFGAQLQRTFPEAAPTLLMAIASRPDEPRLEEQIAQVKALGHGVEGLELLVATSPGSGAGYRIAPRAAKALLGSKNFLVLLVGGDGRICYRADAPAGARVLSEQAAACRRSRPGNSFKPSPFAPSAERRRIVTRPWPRSGPA